MKKKMVWAVVSCLVVLGLLVTSCAQAEEKEAPAVKEAAPVVKEAAPVVKEAAPAAGAEMVKLTLTKLDGTVVEKLVEKPRYGGTFLMAQVVDVNGFDEAWGATSAKSQGLALATEGLLEGEWTRGPAGTGEVSWQYRTCVPPNLMGGLLAESWEFPDAQTAVYHIRKGIRFALNPQSEASRLVNGREITADDVVFSLKRLWAAPRTRISATYPWPGFKESKYMESLTAPDKWTVVMKTKPGYLGRIHEQVANYAQMVPREVIEKYGDMQDWKNLVGTGAFMLTDYVAGSSQTLVRNPNFWQMDPLHPENRLPYLDSVKVLVIPDRSTRLAALRTGRVDYVGGIGGAGADPLLYQEEWQSLMQTNPEIPYAKVLCNANGMYFNQRDPTRPYADVRVRRALSMAINFQEIVDSYYGGSAVILAQPVMPIEEFMDIYIPLAELPESVRELFEYKPEKARQLLAEAGYPNGFKTEVLCGNVNEVDMLSIIKEYWSKVGVDLKISIKDPAVVSSLTNKGLWEITVKSYWAPVVYDMIAVMPGHTFNSGNVNDPRLNELIFKVSELYFEPAKRAAVFKAELPYYIGQSYVVTFVSPYVYTVWQPWVKNYHGELEGGLGPIYHFTKYIWYDQELKKKLR